MEKQKIKPIKKANIGRHTKLTPVLQKKIIKYIAEGNYIETACNAAGVSKQTFYSWLRRGKKGEEPFLYFLYDLSKERAKVEARNVMIIQEAAKKDWKAAMAWLEKKYPKRWAKRDKLALDTPEPLKSKYTIEFRKEFKLLAPEEKKQFIKLAIKFRKELTGINGSEI